MTGFELLMLVATGLERPALRSALAVCDRIDAVTDKDELPPPRELRVRAVFVTEGRAKAIIARPEIGLIA